MINNKKVLADLVMRVLDFGINWNKNIINKNEVVIAAHKAEINIFSREEIIISFSIEAKDNEITKFEFLNSISKEFKNIIFCINLVDKGSIEPSHNSLPFLLKVQSEDSNILKINIILKPKKGYKLFYNSSLSTS